jgi:hypothetical protein
VIASVVCGCGGGVGVGCVDVQVCRIVILALGHCVLHLPGSIPPVASAVFHVAIEDAEQSYTSLPSYSIATEATLLTVSEGRFQKRIAEP